MSRTMLSRAEVPMPGMLWGDYPQRRVPALQWADRAERLCRDALGQVRDLVPGWQARRDRALMEAVRQAPLAADAQAAVLTTRRMLLREGLSPRALAQALACVSAAAQRELGVRPYDTQILAAHTVLNNHLVEMATGEGKTLAVALAAAVGALAGMPVHVVTSNDYLVDRDAERLKPLYRALGLSVGRVVQADDAAMRTRAYACDVTYVTANELVFDYLRDGLAVGEMPAALPQALRRLHSGATPAAPARLLRGLCMAIVDEADAILIDDASVPLILSQPTSMAALQDHAEQALRFARTLRAGIDFTLNTPAQAADLTDAGKVRLQRAADSLHAASGAAAWRHDQHREHAICLALVALHLLQPDRHYLVRVDEQGRRTVQIIDLATGRVAQGRSWSNGLQQLVEAKEACAPSPALETVAQLTFQRFFARYLRLGGLSGTLCEARAELMTTYGKPVRRLALRQPSCRRVLPTRLFKDAECLWQEVAAQVGRLHRQGRPVMVATDSVRDAQALSAVLSGQALPHAVLHARQDSDEAGVVAQAGQRGAVTVTTNMAGRGTDILLGEGVAELGGLHVICCQLNRARRTDRQLAGRAARQGDPGSVQALWSLDAPLLVQAYPPSLRRLLASLAPRLPKPFVRALARWPQHVAEQTHRMQRQRLVEQDERSERQLAFGAHRE